LRIQKYCALGETIAQRVVRLCGIAVDIVVEPVRVGHGAGLPGDTHPHIKRCSESSWSAQGECGPSENQRFQVPVQLALDECLALVASKHKLVCHSIHHAGARGGSNRDVGGKTCRYCHGSTNHKREREAEYRPIMMLHLSQRITPGQCAQTAEWPSGPSHPSRRNRSMESRSSERASPTGTNSMPQ